MNRQSMNPGSRQGPQKAFAVAVFAECSMRLRSFMRLSVAGTILRTGSRTASIVTIAQWLSPAASPLAANPQRKASGALVRDLLASAWPQRRHVEGDACATTS